MPPRTCFLLIPPAALAACFFSVPPRPRAAEVKPAAPAFAKAGVAFVQKHCVHCHGDKVKKADLSLHAFRDDAGVLKGRKVWKTVLEVVRSGEMPPAKR